MAPSSQHQAKALRHRVSNCRLGHSQLGVGQGPQNRGDPRGAARLVRQGRGIEEDQGRRAYLEKAQGLERHREGLRHQTIPCR